MIAAATRRTRCLVLAHRNLDDHPQCDDAVVVAALDALRIAVMVLDSDERIVYLNAHLSYLFRSLPPLSTLIGSGYDSLLQTLIRAGEIRGESDLSTRLRRQLSAGDYRPLDIALASGATLEAKARRTRNNGWIVMWHDISETRHAMQRLHGAIALSADAFAFYDHSDRLILCNGEYAALFGLRPDDLIGRRFNELASPGMVERFIQDRSEMDGWIAKRLQIHRQTQGMMTLEIADGTVYLVRDCAVCDGDRVVVYTDVTEQTRSERALIAARADADRHAASLSDLTEQIDHIAEEAEIAKTTLLRTMSHELKTPLNAIIGFSDLMRGDAERLTTAEISEYADMIHHGGHHLLRLINQILDLTKISAGRYELRRHPIDAHMAIARVMDEMELRAKNKSITMVAPTSEPALRVLADDAALDTMLRNLIDNAITFTPSGGEVYLGADMLAGRVRLSVADNGPGVAPEDLSRIVKPFEQVGRGHAEHTDGAGLGLTLVKALSESQGGRLIVESVLGHGFTATIELPAA